MTKKNLSLTLVLAALLMGGAREILHAEGETGYLRLEYFPFSTNGDATVHGTGTRLDDGGHVFNASDWGIILGADARFEEQWGFNMDLFFGRETKDRYVPSTNQTAEWFAEYAILNTAGYYALVNHEFEESDKAIVLDGLYGIRSYLNNYKLQFEPFNSANDMDRAGSRNWIDPYVGLRLNTKFSHNWAAELYGDAGGFAIGYASKLSVLARANLIWTVTEGFDLLAGYRLFDLETANENGTKQTELNLRMEGVTLGAECRFN